MADAAAEEPAEDDGKADGDAAPAPAPPKADADDGDDLLSSPAFLKQKLKVLEKELDQVAKGTEEATAQAAEAAEEFSQKRTRLQADFDNFKARHYNQTIDAQVDSRIKLLSSFLAVLDNFDRARDSISPSGDAEEKVNAEYQAMHTVLMEALEGPLEVTKIKTVGEEFDYNLHMAIQQMPSDEVPVAPPHPRRATAQPSSVSCCRAWPRWVTPFACPVLRLMPRLALLAV